jgi:hypothetical protein
MRAHPTLCLVLAAALVAGCASSPRPAGASDVPSGSTVARSGVTWEAAAEWVDSHPVARAVVFLGEVFVVTVVAGGILLLFYAAEHAADRG